MDISTSKRFAVPYIKNDRDVKWSFEPRTRACMLCKQLIVHRPRPFNLWVLAKLASPKSCRLATRHKATISRRSGRTSLVLRIVSNRLGMLLCAGCIGKAELETKKKQVPRKSIAARKVDWHG